MNATRANRAADQHIARAVRNVAQAAAKPLGPTPRSHILDLSPPVGTVLSATLLDSEIEGHPNSLARVPAVVEIDGALFTREPVQAEARKSLESSRRWQQLMELVADRPEAEALVRSVQMDEAVGLLDDFNRTMRHIGSFLVGNGHPDLWRVIFIEWQRDSAYVLGDEKRFLLGEPTGQVQPLSEH
jgi:hypothetical protein